MGASKVPEALLERLEKLSPGFSEDVQNLREALETRSTRAAEKALATRYLLTPGAGFAAGMTREEENALAIAATGRGYPEPPEPKEPKRG